MKLIEDMDDEHSNRNYTIERWLNNDYSTAYIRLQLGLIDTDIFFNDYYSECRK